MRALGLGPSICYSLRTHEPFRACRQMPFDRQAFSQNGKPSPFPGRLVGRFRGQRDGNLRADLSHPLPDAQASPLTGVSTPPVPDPRQRPRPALGYGIAGLVAGKAEPGTAAVREMIHGALARL